MRRFERVLRLLWLPAVAFVLACDLLLTDPAATPSTVEIQFQIEGEPLGATAEAFGRVERVLVRLTVPDSVPRDTVVSVSPEEGAVRAGVKLRPAEQIDGLGVMTRLGYDDVWLFEGETVAAIEPGVPAEVEMVLEAIADRVSPDRDPVVIPNVGETVQLSSVVLYASGDTIPGLAGTWSSSNPEVVTVTPGGSATAVSVGEGELVVAYDTLPPVTVGAVVSSVDNGTVAPADRSVAAGSTVQYSVVWRDAFDNVLTDRATTWSTSDATVATIDPDTGLLTALGPGSVIVTATAEGVDATTGLTVVQPLLGIDDVVVLEGDAGTTDAVFAVTLSAASAGDVAVDYATADGTATADTDYTPTSGTLTFPAGGPLTQQILVPVLGDLLDEGASESFTVELTGAVNATIADNSGTGTITDDDESPSLSIDDVVVTEGAGGTTTDATFTVTLSAASGQEITVDYATTDGTATAGSDYTAASGTLTFPAGTTSQQLAVTVIGDDVDEPDETFTVGLTNPTNATIADDSGLGTISDDDVQPSLSIDDVVVAEGAAGTTTDVTFTVTLSAASAQQVTVDYATADGSATAGSDYTAESGTLTFPAGTTSQLVAVTVIGDDVDEGASESFTVGLTNPTNATIADNSGTGTITDDDPPPALSIDDVVVTEGAGGTTTDATFTVSLSAASAQQITVDVATADGTAVAPVDYTTASGTLTFPAGTTSQQVAVTVIGDDVDEGASESFTVGLTNATNATITDDTGIGTITDDDGAPALTIDDVVVTEGAVGTTTDATFTVTLSAASGQEITVDYATADGTATAPDDYTAESGTLTFPAGTTSQQLAVTVIGDDVDEGASESFTVGLTNATNATITDDTGIGTITDDDGAPSLTIDDVVVTEGAGGTTTDATFTVTLSAASGQEITVDYATADGTATAPDDYMAESGTLTFPAGTTSQQLAVTVTGDDLDEPDETYTVGLTNATNATIADNSGLGTITDDDPTPALSIDDVTVTEGDAGTVDAVFTVTLSAASAQQVTVDYATADGTATAGTDYTTTSGTLTFPAGTTTQTISVPFSDDALDEPDETYTVGLTNPTNATIADDSGLGTITDDDGAPSLSIDDVVVLEGDAATVDAVFTVTLSAASAQQVTVDYATADGTATAGTDYTTTSGTLTFPAGTTTQTISVPFSDDALDEPDETYTVGLTNATNATIADNSGLGTITDDDPTPALSIDDVTVTEGDAGTVDAVFTVTLSAASAQQITVDYATADGTATAPDDYTAESGVLTFSPGGALTQTVTIPVNGEVLDEVDETFTVELSNAVNATIVDDSGLGTISDDDPPPSLSIDDVVVLEGDAANVDAVFTVTLSAASGRTVTVDFATADSTATAGSDYTAVSGTMTFAAGTTTQTISVPFNDDVLVEPDEMFTVGLTNAISATIADNNGTGTITDDDVPGFTVTESDGTTVVDESGTTDDFTVVLDAQPLSNVVIIVTSGDVGEVVNDVATLTFTPDDWNIAQTVTVTGVSDTPLDDGDQVTPVTLSVDDANSDDQYDPLVDQTVSVTTVDIDPLMAFTSGTTGNNEIWLRTGAGDLSQVTATGAGTQNWDPEWSPDGQQIVFSSFRNDLNDHVWVMNPDGSGQTALTSDPVQHVYPAWSPDGSQIVFARDTANLRDIWVMNRDGSSPTELMANNFEDSQPDWSPDGTQIVFFSDRTGTWQIFTMGADGSNQTNRSNNDAFEFFPAWSPDGTQIAFVSNRHDPVNFNNWQIYVLDATDFVVTRLTNNAAQDTQPAWTPDGRIVFTSDRDGTTEIYIMNRDGTNQVRLTNLDGGNQFPSIKPEG